MPSRDRILNALRLIGMWAVVKPAVYGYRATVWLLRATWVATKALGRFTMWLVFWPLAMLRANKKSRSKETDRLVAALAEATARK